MKTPNTKSVLRSALALLVCLVLSLPFAGSAVAQDKVSVTVRGFTSLQETDISDASFTAEKSEFLKSVSSLSRGDSKNWGKVTVENANSGANYELRAVSNQGQFHVDASVSSSTSGFKSATLKLKSYPDGSNVHVTNHNPKIKKGNTSALLHRTKPGAMKFSVKYTQVSFDGDAVGDNNLTVKVNYTVSQSAP